MPIFEDLPIYKQLLEFSKQSAALNLLESGVDTNFFSFILDILNSNVTKGSNIDNVIDELKVYITGSKTKVGGLQRYVSQVTNDALTQFNATYNNTIAENLNMQFYKYVGTLIENSRTFCVNHVNVYLHKKEVENIGRGIDIDGTKLTEEELKGRITDTDESNIFINRGGYHCRHFFSPITPRFVPKDVLKRNFDNGNWKPSDFEMNFLN